MDQLLLYAINFLGKRKIVKRNTEAALDARKVVLGIKMEITKYVFMQGDH
jgi:hypothetical protein